MASSTEGAHRLYTLTISMFTQIDNVAGFDLSCQLSNLYRWHFVQFSVVFPFFFALRNHFMAAYVSYLYVYAASYCLLISCPLCAALRLIIPRCYSCSLFFYHSLQFHYVSVYCRQLLIMYTCMMLIRKWYISLMTENHHAVNHQWLHCISQNMYV